ncbi:MAG: hypothetical protein ACFFC7_29195 [Candidatus Hermodarchaeota archaeon]
MKLVRWKIRGKKPGKKIRQKTPESQKSTIISKTPSGSEESFELPPPKIKIKSKLPKSSVQPPSRHGVSEHQKNDIKHTNVPPPRPDQRGSQSESVPKPTKSLMKDKDHQTISSKTPPSKQERPTSPPTNHGALSKGIRKTMAVNRPLPTSEQLKKENKTPRSIGSFTEKKSKFVNKPLPRMRSKKPPKAKIKLPPPTSKGLEKKKEHKAVNRPIPKEIVTKTPIRKKIKPPPTFDDKIPKTRITSKKPE